MAGGSWKRWVAGLCVVGLTGLGCGTETPKNVQEEGPSALDPAPTPSAPADGGTDEPAPTGRCSPSAGAAKWLTEGETVTATIACRTGLNEAGLRFAISDAPAGLRLDATTGTLTWTPSAAQDGTWNLALREETTGETGTFKLGVAAAFVGDRKVKIEDPARYTEELGLPVFHFDVPEGTKLTSGGYNKVTLTYRGKRTPIELKYRGATSSVFPKRSFTLKFPDGQPFDEPVFGNGFTGRKKVVLVSTFNDNAYVRTRLAFDLWHRMSPEHVQLRNYNAVVYQGDRYLGVYTVTEDVNDGLMKRSGLSKDGNLFKAETPDANFSRLDVDGQSKAALSQGFELKEGPSSWAPIEELTAFVADSSNEAFRAERLTRTKASEYEDWWIFNTLILGTDSAGKNALHYYDPATRGPWRFIPWDLDASFGQNFDTTRTDAGLRHTFAPQNRMFARMVEDAAIAGPLRERYRTFLRNELKLEAVLALIDQYERENGAAAKRDWAAWRDLYLKFGTVQQYPDGKTWDLGSGNFPNWGKRTDFNEYPEELAYVREWVRTRWTSFLSSGVP